MKTAERQKEEKLLRERDRQTEEEQLRETGETEEGQDKTKIEER